MNFSQEQIEQIKKHTDKHLLALSQKMEIYMDTEELLLKNIKSFSEQLNEYTFYPPSIKEILHLEHFSDTCQVNANARFFRIREIDNTASLVAGNLALLLDLCMETYSIPLKRWILLKIRELSDMKKEASVYRYVDFFFPTATSVLSPYIFKTQLFPYPDKFAIIRNAIRNLIN